MVNSLKAIAKATTSEGLVKSPNLAIIKTPAPEKTTDGSAPKVSLSFDLGDPDDLTSMSLEGGGESAEPKEPSVAVSTR